jgi:hypothetical protein
MTRFYTKISKEDFLAKVKSLMENKDQDDEYIFPGEMPQILLKDLKKVQFDWENYTHFNETQGYATYPVGYKEVAPDFHVFFVNAGGDWEFPVCFIFYWGEEKLRAYIPEDGNAWNKKEKCAYGSEDLVDENSDQFEKEINEEKMIDEIKKHIIEYYDRPFTLDSFKDKGYFPEGYSSDYKK